MYQIFSKTYPVDLIQDEIDLHKISTTKYLTLECYFSADTDGGGQYFQTA